MSSGEDRREGEKTTKHCTNVMLFLFFLLYFGHRDDGWKLDFFSLNPKSAGNSYLEMGFMDHLDGIHMFDWLKSKALQIHYVEDPRFWWIVSSHLRNNLAV